MCPDMGLQAIDGFLPLRNRHLIGYRHRHTTTMHMVMHDVIGDVQSAAQRDTRFHRTGDRQWFAGCGDEDAAFAGIGEIIQAVFTVFDLIRHRKNIPEFSLFSRQKST